MASKTILFLLLIVLAFIPTGMALDKTVAEKELVVQDLAEAPHKDTLVLPDYTSMVIDHDKGIITYEGVETGFIQDPLIGPEGEIDNPSVDDTKDANAFVHIPYYDDNGTVMLDVYIEETFYYANQAALDDFWDKFYPRFEVLKAQTGWSSLHWFGVPLEIYVYGHSAACYGGNASPTHANVVFSDPMYKTGCHKPYYDFFNGTTYYNNPGELGDWWPYMNTALHEATHSIMPYPIYTRSWLTEGWAEYLMYNVLVETGDINQATADTYLYKGFAGYQWDPYVANDYHDTTVYNRELQRSHGYDITGWLFSKMRDEEGLDWDQFYLLMNNNKDALDRTFSLGPPYIYYTDAFVVNVFGRAMGHTNYWNETDPMFNYFSGGGVDGHGYGARNISYSWHSSNQQPYGDFSWFGELTSTVALTNPTPVVDETVTITANVANSGDVNMNNISVRIYEDDVMLHEEYIAINKNQNKNVQITHAFTEGEHTVDVRVDEDNVKIEQDENNNDDSVVVDVTLAPQAPVLAPIAPITVSEMSWVYIYPSATDANNDPLTYSIDNAFFTWNELYNRFSWKTGPTSATSVNVTVNVTDGMFVDTEVVQITVNNKCIDYDKQNMCWIGCTCKNIFVEESTEATVNLR